MKKKKISPFITINKKFFKRLIAFMRYTSKSLAKEINVDPHVFTRIFQNGRIKKATLDKIGKVLNLDINYITGDFLNRINTNNEKGWNLAYMVYGYREVEKYPYYEFNKYILDKHPYKSSIERTQNDKTLRQALERLFILNNVPFDEYANSSLRKQIDFLTDLNNAQYKVFIKHYSEVMENKNEPTDFDAYIISMENEEEDREIAESIRSKYLKKIPDGYTAKQIKDLSNREIIDLDYGEQLKKEAKELKKKYMKNPPEGYSTSYIKSLSDIEVMDLDREIISKKYFSKYYEDYSK